MGGVVKSVFKGSKRLLGTITGHAFDKPKLPKPPQTPTIDEAAQQTQESDRIRRRRGVLANLYGGTASGASSPTVATKQLLGQ